MAPASLLLGTGITLCRYGTPEVASSPSPIPAIQTRVFAVAWSPDGSRIASGGKDRTVQVWDARGGELTLTYTGHTDCIQSVAWSPDGSRIASGRLGPHCASMGRQKWQAHRYPFRPYNAGVCCSLVARWQPHRFRWLGSHRASMGRIVGRVESPCWVHTMH